MEKRELFQIGDVARMFHLSVGSLRHYERVGLLRPEYVDPDTGYRYYSTRQFECLNTIRYLRALDMPLEQIAGFLKNRDVGMMQTLLRQQREAVARKRRELERIERKIDNRLAQLRDALSSRLDCICLKELPPCRIVWLRSELPIRPSLNDGLETSIRRLEEGQKDTAVFLGKVGVGISQERLELGQYQRYDMVFLLLDPEDRYTGPVTRLPGQRCAVLRFCGSHQEAPEQYHKLFTFFKENGLSAAGFSREITMIDQGLTSDAGQFVTEIQIPVEERRTGEKI